MGLRASTLFEVWCDICSAEPEAIATAGVSRKDVIQTLRAIGWSVSGSTVKCQDCRVQRKKEVEY